jgi:uncharacterized protein (TIGR03067 family)
VNVSIEVNGDPLPEEQVKTSKLVVKGDQYSVTFGDNIATSTFKVDPTKKPKTIDFKPQDGGTIKGIYELDGDTLKLGIGAMTDARRSPSRTTRSRSRTRLSTCPLPAPG